MKTANSINQVSRYVNNSDDSTTKIERVFIAFINGWSGHRFNAERELHDHCLHSTVSTIEKKYHITIQRKRVTVSGYHGKPTSVKVYWIDRDDRACFLRKLEHGN
jgi:hypothetical protein